MKVYNLTSEDLFGEVCELADEEGASDQQMWNDLVDEAVQGHLDLGDLDPEQDTGEIRKHLKARFEEYNEEAGERAHVLDEELLGVEEDNRSS